MNAYEANEAAVMRQLRIDLAPNRWARIRARIETMRTVAQLIVIGCAALSIGFIPAVGYIVWHLLALLP